MQHSPQQHPSLEVKIPSRYNKDEIIFGADDRLTHCANELWKTESYPMANYVSGESNKNNLQSRNETAKKEFIARFEELYKDTKLQTNSGEELIVEGMKFTTNYNNYSIRCNKVGHRGHWYFTLDNTKLFQESPRSHEMISAGTDTEFDFDAASLHKLQEMLAYHSD